MISFDLTGKVAVVTGASSGLGQQFARALSEQGCDVAILARRKERLEEFSKELKQNGQDCLPVSCDVTDEESIKNAVNAVVDHFGKIDILVNNAGVVEYSSGLHDHTTAQWDKVLDTDLKGVFLMAREVSTIMMKQKYGRIVSMSSVVGVMGNAGQVNYAASKSGIIGMTMSLAREVGSRGITVNAVAPGFIQTAMTDVLSDDIKEQMKSQIPLGAFGSVQDIANAVVFLASDEASYLTGQGYVIDGGSTLPETMSVGV